MKFNGVLNLNRLLKCLPERKKQLPFSINWMCSKKFPNEKGHFCLQRKINEASNSMSINDKIYIIWAISHSRQRKISGKCVN